MGHPDYEYRPHSEERRQRQSEAQRARLGIPEGHSRVYGIHVPDSVADTIRQLAQEIARKQGFDAAHAFVARASANEWRVDVTPTAARPADTLWTPERRKAQSEKMKAWHARKREEQRAAWEAEKRTPEYQLRDKLWRLRREQEAARAKFFECKAAIENLEAAEKLLGEARAALRKCGIA